MARPAPHGAIEGVCRACHGGVLVHGGVAHRTDDDWLTWVKSLMDWQSEEQDPGEYMRSLRTDLFAEEVYPFLRGDRRAGMRTLLLTAAALSAPHAAKVKAANPFSPHSPSITNSRASRARWRPSPMSARRSASWWSSATNTVVGAPGTGNSIELYEVSLVTFPMNDKAKITRVKANGEPWTEREFDFAPLPETEQMRVSLTWDAQPEDFDLKLFKVEADGSRTPIGKGSSDDPALGAGKH